MTEVRQIYDSFGGVVSTIHFRGAAETWHTKRTQDVEPILDFNKAMITEGHDGYNPARDMRHVAKVPTVIYEGWQKEFCAKEGVARFGNRDRKRWMAFLKLKLNDRDNKFLRTIEGHL